MHLEIDVLLLKLKFSHEMQQTQKKRIVLLSNQTTINSQDKKGRKNPALF